MLINLFIASVCANVVSAVEPTVNCRSRSNHLRQDGGLCFEVPPWQHQPVELEQHLKRLREKWAQSANRRMLRGSAMVNSDVSRYMDTVLAPFLDTYHRNIQNAYQQLTAKILKRIKDEIKAAVQKKLQIYTEMTELAKKLNVPAMCDEERRAARSLASKHVAKIYGCTEEARASIAKMGKYAEEMISITRKHMQATLEEKTRSLNTNSNVARVGAEPIINVTTCLKDLSRAAVALGYELDLSLTNARRHNEQSCEKLSTCSAKVKRYSEDDVNELRDLLYQCVYA
ncbi:hypothetical protein K1T71_010970 [Dendrolimus kikuchii]|uniref:Uncharacterized protein n=1 Tax=Dendrolimus kikuchii TaxID=765133 RepID=A0ACC1CQD6_9NEOP|nr:hypothetical protein K1T71_010970 [Dendrolimus kikuchii]